MISVIYPYCKLLGSCCEDIEEGGVHSYCAALDSFKEILELDLAGWVEIQQACGTVSHPG